MNQNRENKYFVKFLITPGEKSFEYEVISILAHPDYKVSKKIQ